MVIVEVAMMRCSERRPDEAENDEAEEDDVVSADDDKNDEDEEEDEDQVGLCDDADAEYDAASAVVAECL